MVTCQMPSVGNIANPMMSNGNQFTVTRQMLTADLHMIRGGLMSLESQRVFQRCFCFVLLYNKSLRLGKQNSLFPSGPVIKCLLSNNNSKNPLSTDYEFKTATMVRNYTFLVFPVVFKGSRNSSYDIWRLDAH